MISEAATPPMNSGGPHLGSRDTTGQGNKEGKYFRNKGHSMGFTGYRLKEGEESRSPKNIRGTGSDHKVGGGQRRPSASAAEAP